MLPTAYPELLAALSEERVLVTSFVELLQQEQRLLMENGIDQLASLTDQKSALALRLNALAEMRQRQLEKLIPGADHIAVLNWFEANNKECVALWQEIRTLAEQARQLNHINGELIQMKLRHTQQSLTVLTRAVSQANLYGPTGQTHFSSGSGRSLGSV